MIGRRFASVLVCLTSLPATAGVSGAWEVVGRLPQYGLTLRLDCTLQQDDRRVSGHCRDAAGVALPLEGEVSGNRVTFGYTVDIGEILRVSFEGGSTGTDAMSGRLMVGFAPGSFTASRRSPAPRDPI